MISPLRRVTRNSVVFFNCDITEGTKCDLYSNWNVDSVIDAAKIMARVANILKIPLFVTEHAPKAFGYTFPEIKQLLPKDSITFEKTQFSMLTDAGRKFLADNPQRKDVILYGMESHICIQQTSFSLLESGFNVHLILDGVTSNRTIDRSSAIRRLSRLGVCMTTAESIIYDIVRDVRDPAFEGILKILAANRDTQISEI